MSSRIFDERNSSPAPSGEGLGVGPLHESCPADRPHPHPSPQGERLALGLSLLLLLAACHSSDSGKIDGTEDIPCQIPGQSGYKPVCTMEKAGSPDGVVVTARAPDGGFRRFLIVKDGRGVIAADGAEEVVVKPAGPGSIDVTAGDVTYRLPAKVK